VATHNLNSSGGRRREWAKGKLKISGAIGNSDSIGNQAGSLAKAPRGLVPAMSYIDEFACTGLTFKGTELMGDKRQTI